MSYDDMMGLEFGEYGGLGEWIDMEMMKDTFIAGGAGAGAALLVSWGLRELTDKVDFMKREDPNMQKVQNGAIQFLLGIGGGTALMQVGGPGARSAAMGVTVLLSGLGIVNMLNGLVFKDKPLGLSALPEDMELSGGDASLLSGYGGPMEALAALEATSVSSAPGAFQGFADPTVTPEALMGTMVQEESLGGLAAYAPYLS